MEECYFQKVADLNFTNGSKSRKASRLIVKSQQWKHQSNMQSHFKVNNNHTRMTSFNFDQISHIFLVFPLLTLNK